MTKETIQYQELLDVVRSMDRGDELFYFFLRACENANLQICQICLDAGADINIRESRFKHTLLYEFVGSGKFTPQVGDWLIEKGADINITSISNWTNLTQACYRGNFDIAKYFIDKGIKIRHYKDINHYRESDLEVAAIDGGNPNIVKMLLELGVDLESELSYSTDLFIMPLNKKKHEIVETLLQKGASPNFYINGKTPLHIAVANKDIKMANILLKYNANVNARSNGSAIFINDDVALTPMDIAVLNQDIDMQKLLADFGGIVSGKEEKIQALTECSDSKKSLSVLKKLLASKVNFS